MELAQCNITKTIIYNYILYKYDIPGFEHDFIKNLNFPQ